MPYVLSLARRLVRHAGYAVAAIDGIGHGDRASASTTADRQPGEGISRTFVADVAAAADAMTADWTAALRRAAGARGSRRRPSRLLGRIDGDHVRRAVRGRDTRRPLRGAGSDGDPRRHEPVDHGRAPPSRARCCSSCRPRTSWCHTELGTGALPLHRVAGQATPRSPRSPRRRARSKRSRHPKRSSPPTSTEMSVAPRRRQPPASGDVRSKLRAHPDDER